MRLLKRGARAQKDGRGIRTYIGPKRAAALGVLAFSVVAFLLTQVNNSVPAPNQLAPLGDGALALQELNPELVLRLWGPEDQEAIHPCWWEALEQAGKPWGRFIAVSLSGNVDKHRQQLADAVTVAMISGATLVIQHVEPTQPEEEAVTRFDNLYDAVYFYSAVPGLKVQGRLRENVTVTTNLKVPSAPPRAWILENVNPVLKVSGQSPVRIHLGPVLKERDAQKRAAAKEDKALHAMRCHVYFHALRPTRTMIAQTGHIVNRMREAAADMGGRFLAVDLSALERVSPPSKCTAESRKLLHPEDFRKKETRGEAINKQRAWDVECGVSAHSLVAFLRALQYPNTTAIYTTGLRSDPAFKTLLAAFPNTHTKEYMIPFQEETQLSPLALQLWASSIDSQVFVQANVFLSPAHPSSGLLKMVLRHRRLFNARGVFLQPASVALFDRAKLLDVAVNKLLREMHRANVKDMEDKRNDPSHSPYDDSSCFCDHPSPSAPPAEPPPATKVGKAVILKETAKESEVVAQPNNKEGGKTESGPEQTRDGEEAPTSKEESALSGAVVESTSRGRTRSTDR